MQLTFKDLKQQKFTIEAEGSDTISAVKEKIFKSKSEAKEWEPSLQKLIYSGKILADDKTVEFYKVEEKGFIVCMLQKPKAVPAASASTPSKAPSTPAQTSKPATPSAPGPAAPAASSLSNPAAAPPATPSPAGSGVAAAADPASFNDPSALALGAQRDQAIQNMMEMGFERAEIDRAMRAAFFNPDRAVEYLMTGIPENVQAEQRQAQAPPAAQAQAPAAAPPAGEGAPAAPLEGGDPQNINLFEAAAAAAAQRQGGGAARAGGAAGAGAAAGAGGIQGLDFLRNNPQFRQLRQLVQQSPQMLEPILQQVGQGNPQLAALISQNPDAFLQLLSEGVDGDDEGDGGLPPGFTQVNVTPEEAQAIDRLCGLGFQRDMVVQAYFACDKNEELTANYLADNLEDMMEDA